MEKMTANALDSFCPYHPGELLKEELEYRHLSQKEVAKQLGLPYTAFNEILNGSGIVVFRPAEIAPLKHK